MQLVSPSAALLSAGCLLACKLTYCPQAEARNQLGERCTAFERVANGSQRLQRGDLIRLAVKPAVVGRVQFFSVAQVRGRGDSTLTSRCRRAAAPDAGCAVHVRTVDDEL